jgi:hypothetical protein
LKWKRRRRRRLLLRILGAGVAASIARRQPLPQHVEQDALLVRF